ncbi:hypothetical protein Tco_1518502, partial [Tanacetum coccineum]
IRRIGSTGYGVSALLDMAYQTYWVRHIELFRYDVLGSLGTAYWATPVRCIRVLGYGVLGYSGMVFCTSWVWRIELLGYDVLALWVRHIEVFILLWSLVSAGTNTPYLLNGYGVLVFRIVIFKISSFKL